MPIARMFAVSVGTSQDDTAVKVVCSVIGVLIILALTVVTIIVLLIIFKRKKMKHDCELSQYFYIMLLNLM